MGVATQAVLGGRHNGKVALNAAKSELTLAELTSNLGMHQPLAAAWKQQAREGMAASFNGKMEVTQETSEAELNRLHAKIGQLVFV
ncbi:hypothetical protein [Indioceanicola profundi]|uniref:hypothetical protein n=1 Tax=Indioceanicola profundi TaxID=2220096 RepID=UPI000E6AC188|nr:hypothetical protein [Indioceanicola profundi]